MLYASELAALFFQKTGWAGAKGKPNVRLLSKYLQRREEEDKRVQFPLFYVAKNGMHRVYPYGTEYIDELENFLYVEKEKDNDMEHATLALDKTKYHLYRKKNELQGKP